MNRNITGVTIAVSLGCIVFALPDAAAERRTVQPTGSIEGKISVSGVRNAENVLVYVEKAPGEHSPPKDPAKMDQLRLTFIPHVLPIVKGTTVRFLNSDSLLHNVFWPRSKDGSYSARNLGTWGKGSAKEFTFNNIGYVVLLCNVHPEMEAHIRVLQNPFFAVVGKEGNYEIKGVPAGQYTVKTWYPKPRRLKSKSATVTVTAGGSTELDFSLSRR